MVEKLIKYQQVDEKLRAIESSIKSSEEYKKIVQAKKIINDFNASKEEFEKRSASLLAQFEEKSSQLVKILDEKSEIEESISDGFDEKEIAYLQRHISDLLKLITNLENEIKRIEEDINEVLKTYSQSFSKAKSANEQGIEYKKKYEELVKSKEGEKEEIIKELEAIKKGIPDEIMTKYLTMRKDGNKKIVCAVKNNCCTSCYTMLSMGDIEMFKSQEILECPNCHRLIYLEK